LGRGLVGRGRGFPDAALVTGGVVLAVELGVGSTGTMAGVASTDAEGAAGGRIGLSDGIGGLVVATTALRGDR